MAEAVTVAVAARALGVSVRELRRDMAAGCPVLRRGGRGRGRAALLDVHAVAAWRRSRAPQDGDRLLLFANAIPELVADAMHAAFVAVDGPHKKLAAGALAGAGYIAITALLDRLRLEVQSVPELTTLPEKIDRLRHIFDDSASLDRPSYRDRLCNSTP